MTTLNVTEARANLYKLIDDTSVSHEPVVITGKRGNAVLLAEDDWNAINATLHLLSVPGMRESILEGMQEGIDKSATELEWYVLRIHTYGVYVCSAHTHMCFTHITVILLLHVCNDSYCFTHTTVIGLSHVLQ